MAQTIQLKRSSVAGNLPTSSDLALGEIAINTADGAVYIKKGNNDIVAVADNDILHIDTTNSRIGIGTTSPATDLHIINSSHTQILLESGTSSKGFLLFGDADDLNIGSVSYDHSDNSMRFETDDSERMRIDSSGNVLIGTDSGDAFNSNSALRLQKNNHNYLQIKTPTNKQGGVLIGDTGDDFVGGFIYSNSDDQLWIYSGNDRAIVCDSSQNVGIGTLSPDEKLHISGGGIKVDGEATIASGSGTGVFLDYASNVGRITALDQGTAWRSLRLNAADIQFYIANGEKARIDSSGNVGIGTLSPDTKLDITTAGAEGILLNQDTNSSNVSSRLFFKDSTRTNAILSVNGNLQFRTGATIGSSSGTNRLVVKGNGTITFNEAYTFPAADGSANQVLQTDGSGNLSFATVSGGGSSNSITDADGDTKIQVEESSDEDVIRFDTAGTERMTIGTGAIKLMAAGGNFNTTASTTVGIGVQIKNPSQTSNNSGDYKGAIGFTSGNTNNVRSAIAAKQTQTSANRQGLAFLVHPDTTAGTFSEALVLNHDSSATFGGTISSGAITSTGTSTFGTVTSASYKVGASTVIDNSRNLINIGTISSGTITTSGNIDLDGGLLIDVEQINGVGASGWLDFNMDTDSVYPQSTTDNQTVLGSVTHMNFVGDSNANGTGGIFNFGYGVGNTDSGTFTRTATLNRSGDFDVIGTITSGGAITGTNITSTSNSGSASIYINSTRPTLGFTDSNSFSDANDIYLIRATSGNKLQFQFYDDSAGSTTETFNIDNSGSATFAGTVSVTNQLSISGTTDTIAYLNVTDNGPVYVSYNRSGDRHAYVGFGGSGDIFNIMNEESGGSIELGTAGSNRVTIDSSGNTTITGNATVTGNLTVQGDTTTLNVATLDVEDKNITLNKGSGDTSGSANGAGITIQDAVNSSTDATILWDATNDEFDFSHGITSVGLVSTGTTADNTADSIRAQNSSGTTIFKARNDGVVLIPNNYLFVNSSQGAYITGSLRARGGITNDSGNNLSINSSGGDVEFNNTNLKNITNIRLKGHLLIDSGGFVPQDAEGQEYKYYLVSQGTDQNYKKVADVTISTGSYKSLALRVVLESQSGNFGNTVAVDKTEYVCKFHRSDATLNSVDSAEISGQDPTFHNLRIVKTASGVYELQVRQNTNYRDAILKLEVLSTNGGTFTVTDGDVNGTTSGTITTPTASESSGATYSFNKVDTAFLNVQQDISLPYGSINDSGTDLVIHGTNAVVLKTDGGTAITIPNNSTDINLGSGKLNFSRTSEAILLDSAHSKTKIGLYGGIGTGAEYIGTSANTVEISGTNINLNGASGSGTANLKMGGTTVIDSSRNLTNIGTITTSGGLTLGGGHIQQNNASEIRSKDTGGSVRTIMRVNSSNELEYGWSGNGKVKIMGGGSYTERFSIGTDGNSTITGTLTTSGDITSADRITSKEASGGFYKLHTDGTFRAAFHDNNDVTAIYADGDGSNPFITFNGGATHTTDIDGILNLSNTNASLRIGGTEVISTGRNIANVGSISASSLSTSGDITSSQFILSKIYGFANTGGDSDQYIKFGTLSNTSQDGRSLTLRISSNNGYNAASSQNQDTIVRFKTSNGSSNNSGFYGDCQTYQFGENANSPIDVIVKQVSTTEYEFYGKFATFTGAGSFYVVEHRFGTWSHDGTNTGSTAPSGTTITATARQVFVSGIDNEGAALSAGNITSSGNVNLTSGSLQIGGTTVIDSSRNLNNIGTTTINGAVTLNSTLNCASTIGIAGTTVIDGSRNLTNIGTISSGAITSSSTGTFVAAGSATGPNALNLLSNANGNGVGITFTDNGNPPAANTGQRGQMLYYHGDGASYGSGNAFILQGTESTLTVLADGKLMFKEGLYVKPSSGTGAGTQVIDSSRNLVNINRVTTADGINDAGSAGSSTIFNESGSTADFRIESDSNTHMFFLDGGNNAIGINTSTPRGDLDVNGELYVRAGYATNYADSSGWVKDTDGFSSQTGYYGGNFSSNGSSSEQSMDYGTAPDGTQALIWTATADTNNNADGGWNKTITGLRDDATYMSVVYVRRNGTSTTGNFYHGTDGGHTLNLDGSANTNPYFTTSNISDLPQDVWCVSIGFIRANNNSSTSQDSVGGLYRTDTGERIRDYTTFKMKDASAQQMHRTYLYYSTSGNSSLSWFKPGFYEVNGAEPTVRDLVNPGMNNTVGDTSGNPVIFGGVSNAVNLTITGVMQANNGYKVGSTTIVDSSRNLTNIGTIGSGTITSSGSVISVSGSNQSQLTNTGSIELVRADANAFIDFKSSTSEDYDCRIQQAGNGLIFQTGGNGSAATGLTIDSSRNITISGNSTFNGNLTSQAGSVFGHGFVDGSRGFNFESGNTAVSTIRFDSDTMRFWSGGGGGGSEKIRLNDDANNSGRTQFFDGIDVGHGSGAGTHTHGIFTGTASRGLHLRTRSDIAGGQHSGCAEVYSADTEGDGGELALSNSNGVNLFIEGDGKVGIGTTSPTHQLHVNAGSTNVVARFESTDTASIIQIKDSTGTAAIESRNDFRFKVSTSTENMRLTTGGALHVEGDVTAFSTTVSDERLKDDVVSIDSALDKVMKLRGVEYIWNKGSRKGQKDLGVIAQEVEKVLPEIVKDTEMVLLDEETYKTVDYEKLTAVLIEAVKEQQEQIQKLKEHSHPAKDMCEMKGYEELVARINKLENKNGNN